jgi:hypothetical protein
VIDQTGQAAVFESVEGEEVEGGAEEDSSERSGRAGGTGDASVLGLAKYSSGGAFVIGIPGGCAVGIGSGFHSGLFGRFDRCRRWKRLHGESLESRLLFRGHSHLAGNPTVNVHREADAGMACSLLHQLGMRARFDMERDECAPKIVLADAHDAQRLQRRKEMPAADVLRV